MANDTNKVTFDAMQQAEGVVKGKIDSLTNVLQRSDDIIAALETIWTGDSGTGFRQALESWKLDFTQCLNELGRIDECLGGNKKIYIQSEDERSQQVQAIASQLALH